jgi:hypothetical protein
MVMGTEVTKRALSAGLGLGAVALLTTPRAKADVPFSSFAFQAEGAPTSRTMPKRLAEIKNVKDFGAVGDNSTDDTAAIQAAVNYAGGPYSSASRGTIFFPTGIYRISAPITFELASGVRYIRFLGAPGAKLLGGFGDAMLKRSPNTPVATVCSVENLQLENNHPTSKGIMFHSCIGGKIVNCEISAWRGIETYNSQSISIHSCSLIRSGSHNHADSVGIVAGNGTAVISTDVMAYENGIRHQNAGLIVQGGRYEVNDVGIRIGINENNQVWQSQSFCIQGPSMEQNQTAIQVRAGAGGNISFSCGSGQPVAYGLHIISVQDTLVSGVTVGSSQGFTQAGIAVDGATRLVMMGVSAQSWRIHSSVDTSGFLQTNMP